MKLFIAEKPSVAKAIAAELGVSGRGDGFINCRNDVVVTWCFGHLLEQAEPDAYLPDDIPKTKKGRKIWRMQDLPIFPQHWLMEAKSERGAKKQLSVIGKLLKSAATVVNAGDPDREGQLLVDEVLEHFRARQPVERFWVSAVDPASIRKGLAKLGDNRSYAGMRDAARGRSRADWLLGMNLSRAYTLAGGDGLLAVGRVQTPTLFMVARRDYVVRNFTPVPYLSITADLAKETVPFTARWKPGPDQKGLDEEGRLLIDLDVGRALVERLSKEKTATVLSAETKRRKANPPKAYSLADIQIEASKRFGMTAENTLKVCQSLYEVRKITSYPRTDCGYLPESQHADAPAVLAAVARNFPAAAPACAKADPKLKSPTFNDKKVTAHHGIVPVANTIDPATLTREEADIYRLIVRRYIAQFFPVHEFDATEVVLGIGDETFTAKGRVVRVEGWRILFEKDRRAAEEKRRKNPKAAGGRDPDAEDEDDAQPLPALRQGDVCDVRAVKGREDKTKPPQFFTEGTLIAAMENIWRSFDDPKGQAMLKETGGIGTPATRAAIIAELKRKEYLETEGKYLHCTESGRRLLKRVSPRIRSAAMTAHFEERLRLVESGAEQLDNFVSEYEAFIAAELQKVRAGRTAPSGSARTGAARPAPAPSREPSPEAPAPNMPDEPPPLDTVCWSSEGPARSSNEEGSAFLRRKGEKRNLSRPDGSSQDDVLRQSFLTNSDLSCIAPKPSILQSMLWSPSTRRMFFTLVPILSGVEAPFTLRVFTMVTESPSASSVPLASFTTSFSSSWAASSPGVHSWAHSGQTRWPASSYTYSELHFGQGGREVMAVSLNCCFCWVSELRAPARGAQARKERILT